MTHLCRNIQNIAVCILMFSKMVGLNMVGKHYKIRSYICDWLTSTTSDSSSKLSATPSQAQQNLTCWESCSWGAGIYYLRPCPLSIATDRKLRMDVRNNTLTRHQHLLRFQWADYNVGTDSVVGTTHASLQEETCQDLVELCRSQGWQTICEPN